MLSGFSERKVIPSRDVHAFFKDSIESTVEKRGLQTGPPTINYVAGLLAKFVRAERLFERTAGGVQTPVLAFIYGQAMEARSTDERCACMQRLGDVSLFLSGVFADSFNRKLVDVDYYMSMGEGAYAWLSDTPSTRSAPGEDRAVYAELAENFVHIADVVNEIFERSSGGYSSDVLRLYERWLHTGSERLASQLMSLGVQVNASTNPKSWH
jgi:hypothetical protein